MRPCLFIPLALALTLPEAAMAFPPGQRGHDWDEIMIDVGGGRVATVSGLNVSTAGDANSTTSVFLSVDRGPERETTVHGLEVRGSVGVGRGRHVVHLRCDNRIAMMVSCTFDTVVLR